MPAKYGFSFIEEMCIQCHGCEAACKSWRSVEPGVAFREVKNIWRGSYPNVRNASMVKSCLHCNDPACAKSCPEGAITKRETDGVVVVDRSACTGCRVCLDACPYGIPQFGTDGKMQKCDLCCDSIDATYEIPPCAATCPTKALRFGTVSRDESLSL